LQLQVERPSQRHTAAPPVKLTLSQHRANDPHKAPHDGAHRSSAIGALEASYVIGVTLCAKRRAVDVAGTAAKKRIAKKKKSQQISTANKDKPRPHARTRSIADHVPGKL
jgi:hypothetical protein